MRSRIFFLSPHCNFSQLFVVGGELVKMDSHSKVFWQTLVCVPRISQAGDQSPHSQISSRQVGAFLDSSQACSSFGLAVLADAQSSVISQTRVWLPDSEHKLHSPQYQVSSVQAGTTAPPPLLEPPPPPPPPPTAKTFETTKIIRNKDKSDTFLIIQIYYSTKIPLNGIFVCFLCLKVLATEIY